MLVWHSWNQADKTLLLAAALFLLALCLRLQYPGSILAQGILFCTEAALVGGIADWFAVTALFRRPLGFAWHTAILPRRRTAFIEAAVTMVQQEFFARKKLFRLIHQADLLLPVQHWLETKENQEKVVTYLLSVWQSVDKKEFSRANAGRISMQLQAILQGVCKQAVPVDWLQADGRAQEYLAQVASFAKSKAISPTIRAAIRRYLEEYQQQKAGSGFGAFFANLAQSMDLVNLDEAAEMLQQQLIAMLEEVSVKGSAAQQMLLSIIFEKLIILQRNGYFQQVFSAMIPNLIQEDFLEDCLSVALDKQAMTGAESYELLQAILQQTIADWLGKLHQDNQLQQKINAFLYDLTARSVLQAQAMIGDIIRSVLGRMTDEQLNQLVYDKVDTDLQWIRMNGSIVGAGIGCGLFLLLQLVQHFG